MKQQLAQAAAAIGTADSLIITAGAGMGVDSGLPDFRGPEGFWKAYPPYRKLGLGFTDLASPDHFESDPCFAWGFYGHRLQLYRDTVPHQGFAILQAWAAARECFVLTSNVDGQFQRAGFTEQQVYEIHGSIHHLQCAQGCGPDIWRNQEQLLVDQQSMRAGSVPHCPHCGAVARPNILMFGDWNWCADRSDGQARRFQEFMQLQQGRLVVIEIGAGTAVPSIRHTSEQLGRRNGAAVIRINPREPEIAAPHIGLPLGGLQALQDIAALM